MRLRENQIDPPDFLDEADVLRHNVLTEEGYRWYGYHSIPDAFLYQKRFLEFERCDANAETVKCLVNIWRYDLREVSRGRSQHIGYEAEIQFETSDEITLRLKLFGFPAEELTGRLTRLEDLCIGLWEEHARKERPLAELTTEEPS